jgi:hypothetical protein
VKMGLGGRFRLKQPPFSHKPLKNTIHVYYTQCALLPRLFKGGPVAIRNHTMIQLKCKLTRRVQYSSWDEATTQPR